MALKAGTLGRFQLQHGRTDRKRSATRVAERDVHRLIGASNPQLKLLCIAVHYLADHDSDSFQLNGTVTGANKVTGTVDIQTTGTPY